MEVLKIKRGASFSLECTYKVDDIASSITGMTINAELRNGANHLVQILHYVENSTLGGFFLKATAAETSTWGVNNLRCDIKITEGEIVRFSETFAVNVTREVTE